MNKIHLLILTLMMALSVSAQELSIYSFTQAVGDLSARTNPRKDANGEPCALVKVYVLDNIISVDGEAVGKSIIKGIEKWIYLCNGVKHFKINLQNHYPIEVSFADFNMAKAESNCVYVLKIAEDKVSTPNIPSEQSFSVETDQNQNLTAEEMFQKGENSYYGRGVAQDYSQAAYWYRKAAEQDHTLAQSSLGACYIYGLGVVRDYRQAMFWLQKAAEKGDAPAQCKIGVCYSKGFGVTQDYSQATYWYKKAAEQSYAQAQLNLGYCFHMGNGVEQDYSQAVYWYRKAADQGHELAQCNLGYLYEMGYGVPQDYSRAVYWYQKAAEQGETMAQYNLGGLYEKGRGVAQDYSQATYWYKNAANQGYEDAKKALQKLKDEGKIQ